MFKATLLTAAIGVAVALVAFAALPALTGSSESAESRSCCKGTVCVSHEPVSQELSLAGCSCGGAGCNCINALCGGTSSCGCGGVECACRNTCNFAGTYNCCSGWHSDESGTAHCERYCSRSSCDACSCPVTCRCK
jgi:hypothetical protein